MNLRKALFNIILFITVITLSNSCQKAPINGDLDGQWEVMDVIPMPSDIIIDQRLFFNFNLYVCDLTYYGGLFTHGNIHYNENTLWLDFPLVKDNDKKRVETLRQYGILSNPTTFNVEFTDKHHLILSNDQSTVILVKH